MPRQMIGPLSYIGGKHALAKRIIAMLPAHITYVEAFAGGAQVLFHKEPSKVEVLNDLDGEVVNFYRVCQAHYGELIRYLRFTLVSRQWFAILQKTPPASLTDMQRAARYFYLQKSAYGGLVRKQSYAIHVVQRPNFSTARIASVIRGCHDRLQRVQIESLPYEEILTRYDRPTTLFYLDPPYWGRTLYRHNFTSHDFEALEERLRSLRGKFVLSLNDVPQVRKLFHRFHIKDIQLAYTAQRRSGNRYREVLITNFRR
jgi:DNA adenine methylase